MFAVEINYNYFNYSKTSGFTAESRERRLPRPYFRPIIIRVVILLVCILLTKLWSDSNILEKLAYLLQRLGPPSSPHGDNEETLADKRRLSDI